MKNTIAAILFCLVFAVAAASAQKDYCFENKGKEIQQIISLTVTKNKVEGTFESGGYNPDNSMEMFEFTGTKNGNLMTIKFVGTIPYKLPTGTKKVVWTLGTTTLQIPTYGSKKQPTLTKSFGKCLGR